MKACKWLFYSSYLCFWPSSVAFLSLDFAHLCKPNETLVHAHTSFIISSPPTPSTPLFLQRWWAHLDRPISTKTLNLNCAEKLFPPAITPPALFTPTFNNDTFWPYQPYFPAFSLFCFQFILPRLAGESWRSKKRTDIKPVGLCFSKGAKKSSIKEDV